MDGLPEEFNAEVDEFIILMFGDEVQEDGEDHLNELKEIASFILSDTELEAGSNGEQDVQQWHYILLLFDPLQNGQDRQPAFVLHSYNNREHLFIYLNKLVQFTASDHCQQQRTLY